MPVRRAVARALALALALSAAAPPAAAQTGTLVGRVTTARAGVPVAAARVTVSGTALGAAVDADGRFRLANVPVHARELRARALGYAETAAAFSLAANGTTTVDLAMAVATVELDAVLVTGVHGDTRRRAVGHSVTVVNASEVVDRSAVAGLAEVVQAKIPGLTLLPGSGVVGTAAIMLLRGAGSLGASNSPLIYVDGVRVSTRTQGSYNYDNASGQSTTALGALDVADIESLEIIKGAAATALYGGEAAAGVIQILTKRGRPGRIAWDARLETARSDWAASTRPVNYTVATPAILADTAMWPGFKGKSLGDVLSFRAMSDGRALRTAEMSKLVLSARGGAERYTFFVSGGRAHEEGVYFNNHSRLASVRGNFTFVPTDRLTFATNIALAASHLRLPVFDNATHNLINSSYLAAPGKKNRYPGGPNYLYATPEISNSYDNQTWATRYTIGASADYVPVSWLRNTLRAGLDANVGRTELFFPPDSLLAFFDRFSLGYDNTKGFLAQGRPLNQDVTLSYDGTATRRLSRGLVSNSSVGVQYLANLFRRTDAIGRDLGSGALRSVAAAALTSGSESSSQQKSVGFYAQQQMALDDQLFVTLAARVDNNSAFGARLHRVVYPKASVSYVISEAPYFRAPGVSSLRLRAAWGQAGNSPGPYDAVRAYTASVLTTSDGTTSALRYGSPGNPGIRPERSSEIEVGVEGAFLGDRLGVDASVYSKTTHDALMPVPIAPSTGFTGNQLFNLGEISNRGIEVLLKAVPVRRRSLAVDATLALSANRNRLVSFGDGRQPMQYGTYALSQRFQEGYPMGGMWAQRLEHNPDGTLLKVNGLPAADPASVYRGPSVPTREISFSGGVLAFGRLRLSGLADYKGGHWQFDVKQLRRDRAGVSWETVDPAADPDVVLTRKSVFQTDLHIKRADFVKLRDVSLGWDVPGRLLRGVARRATLSVAGHNLATWTRYGASDPEVSANGLSTFNRNDSFVVPQTRRFSAAVALSF